MVSYSTALEPRSSSRLDKPPLNPDSSTSASVSLIDAPGPLAGIRVLALEQSVAGPVASRILADMGADVVKVEPSLGDFSRHWDSHVHGYSSHFIWLSRRKRSIALNLRSPQEREVLDRLLNTADVLVVNMAVAAAERLGLTPGRLREACPRLVVCQISGYGRTGATRNRKAYDMLLQAETGLLALTGDERGVVRIGVSLSDVATGIYASSLILAALLERGRTHTGRFIDLSMFEVMTELAGPNLTAFANAGVSYERNRIRHHNIVPYGVFDCSDRQIAIAIQQDSEWRTFSEHVLERPDLAAREDLGANQQRVDKRAEVEFEVEGALRLRTRNDWQQRLDAANLAYGIINDIEAVWDHQVEHDLGLHGSAELPDGTPVSVPLSPAERAFGRVGTTRIPGRDEHRAEIIAELGRELVG